MQTGKWRGFPSFCGAGRAARVSSRASPLLDLILMLGLAVSLGLLLASHVALSVGLGLRGPWHRGLVAFLVPPLAPFWGYSGKLHTRSIVWIASLVAHVACVTAAAIGS